MKHRGEHRGATPSLAEEGLFCGISQKRSLIILWQLRMIRCDNGHGNYADIFVLVIRRISSGMNFCRATSCPLAAQLSRHKAFSTRDPARADREVNCGAQGNRSGALKPRSSLNRLLTDRRTAHNICRVCQSLHLKERK